MQFRKARLEDVDGIYRINQYYLRTSSSNSHIGFLLGDHSKKWIATNLNRYFVVSEGKQVMGYAELDIQLEDEIFAIGKWISTSIKKKVLEKIKKNQFVYLVQLASGEQRRGIGKLIVEGLTKKFSDTMIISFVAFKPHFNEVSLKFHEKMGFQKAGTFTMKYKFGIHRYEHICYFK
jgi:L-amino acid N-acyltransferase YncA